MPARKSPAAAPAANRRALAAEAHKGWPSRGGGTRAVRARAQFARCVWNSRGERRLPTLPALDRALRALAPGDLEWICEFSPLGPLYLLPTTRWIDELARTIRGLGARRILEVAAGDGFLSRSLAARAPDLDVQATDSAAWERPEGRMSAAERRQLRGVAVPGLAPGANVQRLEAREAVRRVEPDLVLAAWLPPGTLLERLIRSPVEHVLEIGAAGGVTPDEWNWRWAHDILEGPVERFARCRLDERPAEGLRSTVTLYFGAKHPAHAKERVRPGDWLWQFRPVKAARRARGGRRSGATRR